MTEENCRPIYGEFATYSAPNVADKLGKVTSAFNDCLHELAALLPTGREFSIVRTKLEEASFFAKKAVAKQAATEAYSDLPTNEPGGDLD